MMRSRKPTTQMDHFRETLQQAHTSNAIAGGVAGALSKTCTAPLARITILFQVQGMQVATPSALPAASSSSLVLQYQERTIKPDNLRANYERPSIAREAYRIVSEEGCLAFWKGNLVTILHRVPYSAINFYAFQKYKEAMATRLLQHGHTGSTSTVTEMSMNLMAGAGAGITAASLAYPLDLLRTRFSAQRNEVYYRGILHALRTIARDEGFKGLYKGLGPTLLNVGPAIAINFCVYGTLRSAWEERLEKKRDVAASDTTAGRIPPSPTTCSYTSAGYAVPWCSLAFGSVAGVVSTTATFPLDVVRKRRQMELGAAPAGTAVLLSHGDMQNNSRIRSSNISIGVLASLKQIAKREGWRGLYRGIAPEYLKVIPNTAIMFMTFEFVKGQLQKGSI